MCVCELSVGASAVNSSRGELCKEGEREEEKKLEKKKGKKGRKKERKRKREERMRKDGVNGTTEREKAQKDPRASQGAGCECSPHGSDRTCTGVKNAVSCLCKHFTSHSQIQ